jgi:tRNA(fMet)-specific endonuclease VapC
VAGRVVVDTDLVIDYLRGKGQGVAVVRHLVRTGRLRLTAVSGFELRVGLDFVGRRDDIMALFRHRTLPLDLHAALNAGKVASQLKAAGTPVGFADYLQAGICLRHGLPFATRNNKHFNRVDGLELADLDELGA